ncbi:sigma-54 dependent transcriptional regulator [Hydrogenivirga sp. 128-5-R1-1]|uniref:sigma-54-dependent transcriptional regulator n=1 Tax=Hydrogenivirga sp. 128-5-R1-1 TaxID=392423 RepID=UPI00015F2397|nr:sigma-54 dependent transcriptional regulator [Hydrogenivirga sp. 128-5-R1-1]EDP74147.1 two component, sigma54 specific, transcriptional regulator, Fis family protein [Hydrogenivirga sp. 128-5-R1-1]
MSEKKKILIIDDDRELLTLMKAKLSKNKNYKILTESSPLEALNTVSTEKIDLAIIDKNMPQLDGIEVLRHIKSHGENIQVIMMTGFGSIEDAVEAMRLGAYHYITKPINYDELELVIKQALEHKDLKEENIRLRQAIQEDIITENPIMKSIIEKARKIAPFDTNVLITGESGTGKEVLAKFIHKNSKRADKPFIAVNCGAIPADLLESELFGYKKGAFTGAISDKKGIVQQAEGGTLFLDEIGELPLNLQVKLLRLIQNKEFIPVGDTNPKKVDIRIISATNRDLHELMKEGKFREDLFYRINTIHFQLPPLRERKEDIIPLAKFFIKKVSLKYGIPEKKFSKNVINQLLSYSWPGNIRELEGVIERTVLMEDKPIIDSVLLENNNVIISYTKEPLQNSEIKPFKQIKEEFEKKYFENLLKETSWNISKASKLSGKTRAEIYRMIKKYNLSKE